MMIYMFITSALAG